MSIINIPPFIKNMGHQLLSFMLNVDEELALLVQNGQADLDEQRAKILTEFIKLCRQLRLQYIDQDNIDVSFFHTLFQISQDDRHVFNIWNEQLGGEKFNVSSTDPVIYLASKMALEMYPLFLIKVPASSFFTGHRVFPSSFIHYQMNNQRPLMDAIMNDASMFKLFTEIGDNAVATFCQYTSSTGRGGSIQLAVFPSILIENAYELMCIRGDISQQALIASVEEIVQMLREIGEGNQIDVPVFVGFHNVGLDNFSQMEIEWGKIRTYTQEIIDLLPHGARPPPLSGKNKFSGLILESKYPYKLILGEQIRDWPPELEQATRKLEIAEENLSYTLALSIDRTPPIGITRAWTLIFDPLCTGLNLSYKPRAHSVVPHYLLKSEEQESIKYWAKLINDSPDEKIRIAIRRILSSINDRQNPIDGFVDVIIAWENLFGGQGELSFRTSVAISKLLKKDQEARLELQSKLVKYYNNRSKVVHGRGKVMSHEEATKKRDECLSIALEALKELYINHPDLIPDEERSKKLALL